MLSSLKLSNVNLYTYPLLDHDYCVQPGSQVTIGDLHGNTIKLIYCLILHGIAENINPAEYAELVKIYRMPTELLTRDDLDRFVAIIQKMHYKPNATLRLIGDELADRGSNDYFTLKVLESLHRAKVPVEIILSNHGVQFIEYIEKHLNPRVFVKPSMTPSFSNLLYLQNKNLISQEEILDLTYRCYYPMLKLLSYTLDETAENITIFSHAPIDLRHVGRIGKMFGLVFDLANAKGIAGLIEQINLSFSNFFVAHQKIHTLIHPDGPRSGKPDLYPIEFLLWNRCYGLIWRGEFANCYFVHGHDSKDILEENALNLDNYLGKTEDCHRGQYHVQLIHPKIELASSSEHDDLIDQMLVAVDAPQNDIMRYFSSQSYDAAFTEADESRIIASLYSERVSENSSSPVFFSEGHQSLELQVDEESRQRDIVSILPKTSL